MDETWEEIARDAAKEIGIDPTRIEYIEARGFLCHELFYLLGGQIEFIITPWWRLFRRLGDIIFGVFPLCRWYPPDDSILEWVGYHSQCKTKVYRLTITQDDRVLFFVEYEPEAPIGSSRMFFPYNVPQLVQDRFLRPPFEKNKELISNLPNRINRELIKACSTGGEDEIDKGLWEGFMQIAPRKPKDDQK